MHSISKFTTLLFSFSLLFLQINCAKTTDVEPITEPINPVDTTNTDLDTVYLNANISGFIINEVLYDPPSGLPGDANNDGLINLLDVSHVTSAIIYNNSYSTDLYYYDLNFDSEINIFDIKDKDINFMFISN